MNNVLTEKDSTFLLSFPRGKLRQYTAFTFIELMLVIVLLSIIAAISLPAFNQIATSGNINHAILTISGLLEQSRQFAVANNTYVYVGLNQSRNQKDESALSICVLASADGTDVMIDKPVLNFDEGDSGLQLLGKIINLKPFETKEGGSNDYPETFKNTEYFPIERGESLANSGRQFIVRNVVYQKIFWYGPDGSARIGPFPTSRLEFGIQPQFAKHNVALFQISGLTGLTKIYRAGI